MSGWKGQWWAICLAALLVSCGEDAGVTGEGADASELDVEGNGQGVGQAGLADVSETDGAVGDTGSGVGGADRGPDEAAMALILGVEEAGRFALPGLKHEVQVVRTELGVPHIYAKDREDLSRAYGFVTAQDRYFMIDLARRLGSGRLTELLGSPALANDLDARGAGMAYVADRIVSHLTSEQSLWVSAFAEGINAYIAEVGRGALPAPSELALAAPLLGAEEASDLMAEFTVRDVASMLAAVIYESSFETGDVGRAHSVSAMETLTKA